MTIPRPIDSMLKHIKATLDLFTCISGRVGKSDSTGGRCASQPSPRYIRKAVVHLPLIGWISGALAGLCFYYCAQYFSTFTASLLAIIVSILFTGAIHEKGLAHSCDDFANDEQNTPSARVRLGTHGTLGLLLVILLKASLIDDVFFLNGYLRDEMSVVVLIFMCTHSLSRLMAATLVYFTPEDKSSARNAPWSLSLIALSGLLALVPLGLLIELSHRPHYSLILLPMMTATWCIFEYTKNRRTQNKLHSLGVVQQVNELICLATFAIIL